MKSAILFATLLMVCCPAIAVEACKSEYERGQREMGAYGEMLGVIEGTLYGHSLRFKNDEVCLPGKTPKEKVRAIAETIQSEKFRRNPVMMDDVPSESEARSFFNAFFPCSK